MVELFDHTADLGIRIASPDLPGLYAEAVRGFALALLDEPTAVLPAQARTLTVVGEDREYLLFDLLRELLAQFEDDRFLPLDAAVTVGPPGLIAVVRGEPFDAARHRYAREVKAITYHELSVTETPDGFVAEVIVDI